MYPYTRRILVDLLPLLVMVPSHTYSQYGRSCHFLLPVRITEARAPGRRLISVPVLPLFSHSTIYEHVCLHRGVPSARILYIHSRVYIDMGIHTHVQREYMLLHTYAVAQQ